MKFKELEPLINNRVVEVYHYERDVYGGIGRRIKDAIEYASTDKLKEDKDFMNNEILWIEARSHEYGMLAIGVIDDVDNCKEKDG